MVLFWLTRLGGKINYKLEFWREKVESKGFKLCRNKTEYVEHKFGNRTNK